MISICGTILKLSAPPWTCPPVPYSMGGFFYKKAVINCNTSFFYCFLFFNTALVNNFCFSCSKSKLSIKLWSDECKIIYHKLLSKADTIRYIAEEYTKTCMSETNDYMFKNSSKVIALFNAYKMEQNQLFKELNNWV